MRGLLQFGAVGLVASAVVAGSVSGQETAAPANPPAAEPPPVPQGVEVLARGPVHEAFATPTTEPVPTKPVPKLPPKPLDEMPPDQKPDGNVVWIGGYWAWDDERKDFLWVSGVWRTVPPSKQWVAGYWRPENGEAQWVPGFWTAASQEGATQEVTYFPAPPAPPEVAPPGQAPTPDSFFVPGVWVWNGERYAWRAGYWARVQPGYVWVTAHYRWTPGGYVFIPGYWDLAISRRGVLFAPVVVNPGVVGASFVYTPTYVVRDTVMLDAFFVRPCYCHYYFGDYYGPVYREYGFESCVVYSRRCYDPVFVYARWEHRDEPRWEGIQVDITLGRHAGRVDRPPRTLVQQNVIVQRNVTNVTNINNTTIINNTTVNKNQMLVPASQMSAVTGTRTVSLDGASRQQARLQAQAGRELAVRRTQTEVATPGSRGPITPHVSSLQVPHFQPVGPRPGPTASAAVTPGPVTAGPARGLSGPPNHAAALPGGNPAAGPANAFPASHPGNTPQPPRPGLTPPPSAVGGLAPGYVPGGPNALHAANTPAGQHPPNGPGPGQPGHPGPVQRPPGHPPPAKPETKDQQRPKPPGPS